MSTRPPYLSIMLLSSGALAYEILLMRLFSIIQWHHFAYMIIGLALFGYGISGTLISITQHLLLPRYRSIFIASVLLFSVSTMGCFFAAQTIPFNAEAILWDGRQALYLVLIFLLLTLPFFFASSAICLTFRQFGEQVPRVYAMDLIGAGVGSLGIVFLLFHIFPQQALVVIGLLGLAAALVAGRELMVEKWLWIRLGISFVLLIMVIAGQSLKLNLSPYKSLVQTLRISGTRIIEERSSPLGLLSVVESKNIPLRHAPGLSLNATQEPPPQLGVFTDGDNMTVITRFPESVEKLAYLDQTTSALPYHLKNPRRVLIMGAGGGADILQAKYHDVPQIDAVELNPQLVAMIEGNYNQYAGELFQQEGTTIHVDEARGFLTKSSQRYDLIQLALVDSFNASASGLYALNESYLYTVEALKLYLDHVEPGGFLSLTRWIKMPPRDTLKLFATAVEALRRSGIRSPGKQLVLVRSWQTSTLLMKTGVFQKEEIRAIQKFCEERLFDMAYTPAITPDEVNRFNILKQPFFYLGALDLLGAEREEFFERYKFNLRPASDDRPYFHHFFKWSSLPEIFQLRGRGGMPLIEWGYMVLIATLAIGTVMSVVLILLPLWFFRRSQEKPSKIIKGMHVICYFFAIGLAFLFVEIAFIQKFILFLHHPIYAIPATLTAFLVFAGMGSYSSKKLSQQRSKRQVVWLAVSSITVLCATYIFAFPPLFASLAALSIEIKIFLTILLIAPLAFFMGMPFPMALASMAEHTDQLVPWAWGINGCASVVSAVLATLLAVHFGFTAVILCAVGLYAGSASVFPQTLKKPF